MYKQILNSTFAYRRFPVLLNYLWRTCNSPNRYVGDPVYYQSVPIALIIGKPTLITNNSVGLSLSYRCLFVSIKLEVKTMGTEALYSVKSLNSFEIGSRWPSFERFRTNGASGLEPIKNGKIGVLHVKGSEYRILSGADFQYILGLATEVDRLKKGLKVVLCAAKSMERHGDEVSLETLKAAVSMIIEAPELPTRNEFDDVKPENFDLEPDDEIELDNIERPLVGA